ncbi:MAG: MinD/ParA family protein [Desulfobacterales bacterium]|nr:MinD/ParA family protein [Desulfobacterales bacterium]
MDQASSLRKMVDKQSSDIKKNIPSSTQTGNVNGLGPRVISVSSGKGGVGKTNIVGNLAMAFASQGKRVLILDADLGLANIDIIFGIHPTFNIGHVLNGEKQLSEIIVEASKGIHIIPAGSGFVNLTHLTEGQKLSLLSEFETIGDMVDIFLIDTGAGISTNVLYFNIAADDCVIVATPEPTSVTDAYAMIKVMSTRHDTKHFKLLMNMVKDVAEAKSVYQNLCQATERFLNDIVIEYAGYITFDESVRESVRQRKTVISLYPDSIVSGQIKKIADTFLKWPRRSEYDGNIKFFMKRFVDYKMQQ